MLIVLMNVVVRFMVPCLCCLIIIDKLNQFIEILFQSIAHIKREFEYVLFGRMELAKYDKFLKEVLLSFVECCVNMQLRLGFN